jgi:hypothetical protein
MLEPLVLAAGSGFFVLDTLETGLLDEVGKGAGRENGAGAAGRDALGV